MDAVGATNVAAIVKGPAQALNAVAHAAATAVQTGFEDVLREQVGGRREEHAKQSELLKSGKGITVRASSAKGSKHSGRQPTGSADVSTSAIPDANAGVEGNGAALAAGAQAVQLATLETAPYVLGVGEQVAGKTASAGKATSAAEGKALKSEGMQGWLIQGGSLGTNPAAALLAGDGNTQAVATVSLAAASLRVSDVLTGMDAEGGSGNAVAAVTMPGALNGTSDHAHTAKTTATDASAGAGERFERPEEARVFEASTNALEVGIASGAHGWLRVRAELDTGGAVVAQMMAGSAGAAASLHKELPAISAYLAHEQVGVSSLVVNAMERGAGTQDAGSGEAFGFGSGQGSTGAGGGGAQESGSGASDRAGNIAWNEAPASRVDGLDGWMSLGSGGWMGGPFAAATNGGWLNVRV